MLGCFSLGKLVGTIMANSNYKIVSFGDSFVFGSELENNESGEKSWIGQAAKKLGVAYETLSIPGCGNDSISRQIYSYFSKNSSENVLAVINWTWASRWDFYLLSETKTPAKYYQITEELYNITAGADWPLYSDFAQGQFGKNETIISEINQFVEAIEFTEPGKWFTLGQTCVPEKLKWINDDSQAVRILNFYNDYIQQSILWNNFRNLQSIHSTQYYLDYKKINVIQTYMDYELFVDDNLLADNCILELQNKIKQNVELFDRNLNFLDWARSKGFPVTPSPGDHPLEEAHKTACDLWIERYEKKLFTK